MKFIAMATFGAYLSTCPELDPLSLDLNVYHKAFLLYSFLRTGESLNPEYYCGEEHACPSSADGSYSTSVWVDLLRFGSADAFPCPPLALPPVGVALLGHVASFMMPFLVPEIG